MSFSILSYFYGYSKSDIGKLTIQQFLYDLDNISEILKLFEGGKGGGKSRERRTGLQEVQRIAELFGVPAPKG